MMKLYSQKDVNKKALRGARIAVLGYGSQGRAHALNLKDSGFDVVVGVRKGGAKLEEGEEGRPGSRRAGQGGARRRPHRDAGAGSGPEIPVREVESAPCKKGATLLFAHGFNIHFKLIKPRKDLDVVLIAPEGARGSGAPPIPAGPRRALPHRGRAGCDGQGPRASALAYAHGIGGTRGGVLETTFAEETETDLFGEQAVLCGGATELVVKGFETLVEAGYQPEVAYYECLHELKLIVDLLHEGGLPRCTSSSARRPSTATSRAVRASSTTETKNEMRKMLKEVQTGKFARQWIEENASPGSKEYQNAPASDIDRQIEKVGAALRARMPWLNERRA